MLLVKAFEVGYAYIVFDVTNWRDIFSHAESKGGWISAGNYRLSRKHQPGSACRVRRLLGLNSI